MPPKVIDLWGRFILSKGLFSVFANEFEDSFNSKVNLLAFSCQPAVKKMHRFRHTETSVENYERKNRIHDENINTFHLENCCI